MGSPAVISPIDLYSRIGIAGAPRVCAGYRPETEQMT